MSEENARIDKEYIFGVDGDMITCKRMDFYNLQESPCGFGYTHAKALRDLLRQELVQ